jgi:hypothetical protein
MHATPSRFITSISIVQGLYKTCAHSCSATCRRGSHVSVSKFLICECVYSFSLHTLSIPRCLLSCLVLSSGGIVHIGMTDASTEGMAQLRWSGSRRSRGSSDGAGSTGSGSASTSDPAGSTAGSPTVEAQVNSDGQAQVTSATPGARGASSSNSNSNSNSNNMAGTNGFSGPHLYLQWCVLQDNMLVPAAASAESISPQTEQGGDHHHHRTPSTAGISNKKEKFELKIDAEIAFSDACQTVWFGDMSR